MTDDKPVPLLLFCPECGAQHIDAPEFVPDPGGGDLGVAMRVAAMRATAWTNPPHRSHLCHACGCIWRPADVPTEGVKAIETRGKDDNWWAYTGTAAPAPTTTPTSAPVEDVGAVEKIARIIDPEAWDAHDVYATRAAEWKRVEPGGRLDLQFSGQAADLAAPSLAKAGAILAALIQPQGEER